MQENPRVVKTAGDSEEGLALERLSLKMPFKMSMGVCPAETG